MKNILMVLMVLLAVVSFTMFSYAAERQVKTVTTSSQATTKSMKVKATRVNTGQAVVIDALRVVPASGVYTNTWQVDLRNTTDAAISDHLYVQAWVLGTGGQIWPAGGASAVGIGARQVKTVSCGFASHPYATKVKVEFSRNNTVIEDKEVPFQ